MKIVAKKWRESSAESGESGGGGERNSGCKMAAIVYQAGNGNKKAA